MSVKVGKKYSTISGYVYQAIQLGRGLVLVERNGCKCWINPKMFVDEVKS